MLTPNIDTTRVVKKLKNSPPQVLNLETNEELQMETDQYRRKYYEMQARVIELRAKLEILRV
jgi:hypothetical protein